MFQTGVRVRTSVTCKTCCFLCVSGRCKSVIRYHRISCIVIESWRPQCRARLAVFYVFQAGVRVLLDITASHVSSLSHEDLSAVQDLLWLFYCQKLISVRNDCQEVNSLHSYLWRLMCDLFFNNTLLSLKVTLGALRRCSFGLMGLDVLYGLRMVFVT